MSSTNGDSYTYGCDEENVVSDDVSDEVYLPQDVDQEIQRRMQANLAGNPITDPAPPEMLQEVRKYFLEDGGNPMNCAGYLDLCGILCTGTPRSDDVLVKREQYNLSYVGFAGGDTVEWWRKQTEQHEGRVRLLRYQEFIQHQEANHGLSIPTAWALDGNGPKIPGLEEDDKDEEEDEDADDAEEPQSSLKNEYDLDDAVLKQFGLVFTTGFYYYVNHDKINNGLAVGTQLASRHATARTQHGGALRAVELNCNLNTLLRQSEEVRDRYKVLRCPLGPRHVLEGTSCSAKNTKKKGKKKGRGGGGGNNNNNNNNGATNHAGKIKNKTGALLETLYNQKRPSHAMGQLYLFIAEMLIAGARADVDLVRTLLGKSKLLLKLRKVCLDNALKAEGDLTRPPDAAVVWWQAESVWTELVCKTVVVLMAGPDFCAMDEDATLTDDGKAALEFFKDQVQPAFLQSLQSKHSQEQLHSLYELGNILLTLPVPIAFAFIKDKENWALLESLCEAKPVPDNLNSRQSERELHHSPYVPAQVARLFHNICCRGLKVDSIVGVSVPGKLVHKMTERGCVPLLISMAKSPHDSVSLAALAALGDISRNKECRLLMLQDPNGIALICDVISKSTNGSKVSPALLLIVHLLWDEEWRNILLDLDDPTIEQVMVRWSMFAMKEICLKSFLVKENGEKGKQKMQELLAEKLRAIQGSIEAEQAELIYEEFSAKREKTHHWSSLEVKSLNDLEMNSLLRRSLMCLGHLSMIGHERMKRAGVLHLIACCIDVPDEDVHGSALRMMHNYAAATGRDVQPSDFLDPDHVLRSIIIRMERLADDGEMNQTAAVCRTTAGYFSKCPGWSPFFDRIAAEDQGHKFMIDQVIKRSPSSFAVPRQGTCAFPRFGVDGVTGSLSGRLVKCDGCGKIEGKKGDFKTCGRCKTAKYCGRDCQLKHWRQGHKKQCAKLAAALANDDKYEAFSGVFRRGSENIKDSTK